MCRIRRPPASALPIGYSRFLTAEYEVRSAVDPPRNTLLGLSLSESLLERILGTVVHRHASVFEVQALFAPDQLAHAQTTGRQLYLLHLSGCLSYWS